MEKYKKILEQEGFAHVYEWTDEPNKKYEVHKHKGKVSFYVVQGDISMNIAGRKTTIKKDERIDVPVGVEHTAVVGKDGCTYVVGEEIEGDS